MLNSDLGYTIGKLEHNLRQAELERYNIGRKYAAQNAVPRRTWLPSWLRHVSLRYRRGQLPTSELGSATWK